MMCTALSEGALYETCRSLADRGEDYGWNAYYCGTEIPARDARRIGEEGGGGWLEAFSAAIAAYRKVVGREWRY